MSAEFIFRGDNDRAFRSRERELLLAGPAGTGKSLCLLIKCYKLLQKYPKCRGLFCRGTRSSLTESGLVTWEEVLEWAGYAHLCRNTVRRVRQNYQFPNGSVFVVAGLDDEGKTLSAQYDFIYVQEATEEGVTLGKYETMLRALRNGRMVKDGRPWHQIMSDCNPTTPEHFLYKRQDNGGPLKMYRSTHRDNPLYWDAAANDYTPFGREYIEGTLKAMSGARRLRFYEGSWEAATGLVYDYRSRPEYDPITGAVVHPGHLLEPGWRPETHGVAHWPRVWAIDWGLSAPTVCQMWAVDPQGRMYLYREAFRTHQRPDTLGKWAKELVQEGKEPIPRAIVCDHDEKNRKQFQDASGLSLTLADKTERDRGIETTQARFDLQADGRPMIFFSPTALDHPPDPRLVDASCPASTVAEIAAYTWEEDLAEDSPIKYNDHGADALRYCARHVDTHLMPQPVGAKGPARDPFSRLDRNTWR